MSTVTRSARAERGAGIKEWWTSVIKLIDEPEIAAKIFREHGPDGAGLKVCATPGDARNLPWPCPTQSMAKNALILRAHWDRAEGGDDRPLR